MHALLETHGDGALRTACERGLAEQAIGAEYIAHYLGAPIPPLPFGDEDRPSTLTAYSLPRAGRVQAAEGARRAGAQRRGQTGPRENSLGYRDRLPRNPERLRCLLYDRAALIDDLSAAFRAGELMNALPTYTHPAVLVVDEVGYLT